MLTKELYDKLCTEYLAKKSGITIGIVSSSGTQTIYPNEACYMQYYRYWKRTATHTVVGSKFDKVNASGAMAFLFAKDSPFLNILKEVYEYSYKDWIDWKGFTTLILDKVLILEHSQINNWSIGSIMTLTMAHREAWGVAPNKSTGEFTTFADILSTGATFKSGYWHPASIVGSASYKIAPHLDSKLYQKLQKMRPSIPIPMKGIYPDNPSPKLSKPITEHSEWQSGLDIMFYCIWGIPTTYVNDVFTRLMYKPEKLKEELTKIYQPWS